MKVTPLIVLLVMVCAKIAQGGEPVEAYYPLDFGTMLWSGDNVIFLLTTDQELYRSTDEGQTWTNQARFLPNSDYFTNIVMMEQDEVDDQKIMFVGPGQTSGWSTTDGGQSYTYLSFGFKAAFFKFHPTITGWGLGFAQCLFYYGCVLHATQDFGQSWIHVADNTFQDAYWAATQSAPQETILYRTGSTFAFTSDFGKSSTTLLTNCYGFVVTTSHTYAAMYDPNNINDDVLVVSSGDYTVQASYLQVHFPFGDDLPRSGYTFLDDTTGAEWVGVANQENWGSIYTSDAKGFEFTFSLQHAHQFYQYFDFDMFNGLEGIYIGNNVSNYEQTGEQPLLTTLITYDNGGEWKYLTPPALDANGENITCVGKCSLHLNGIVSYVFENLGPFYSSPNAIGLLVATGNVGPFLSSSNHNTYFSRDAGLTWVELLKGSYIYEFGDHGGVIVFAIVGIPTSQILYSLDEGLSMNTFILNNGPVYVKNIISNPDGTSRKFILYGTSGPNGDGVVISLDFSAVQPRACISSDYETWTPTDGRKNGQPCQLGRNVTYSRRKQSANCYNDRAKDPILSSVNCACATEDYECDFGYEESMQNGTFNCVLNSVNPPVDPPKYCPPGTPYYHSHGYRLVAGDSCVGELDQYKQDQRQCPTPKTDTTPSSSKALVAVVVIFVVLGVLGVAGFVVYRNEEWREKVLAVVGKVIPIGPRTAPYSRLAGARHGSLADEEFGIGGEPDLDDSDVEEDAPVLQDNDIVQATATDKRHDDFDPRTP